MFGFKKKKKKTTPQSSEPLELSVETMSDALKGKQKMPRPKTKQKSGGLFAFSKKKESVPKKEVAKKEPAREEIQTRAVSSSFSFSDDRLISPAAPKPKAKRPEKEKEPVKVPARQEKEKRDKAVVDKAIAKKPAIPSKISETVQPKTAKLKKKEEKEKIASPAFRPTPAIKKVKKKEEREHRKPVFKETLQVVKEKEIAKEQEEKEKKKEELKPRHKKSFFERKRHPVVETDQKKKVKIQKRAPEKPETTLQRLEKLEREEAVSQRPVQPKPLPVPKKEEPKPKPAPPRPEPQPKPVTPTSAPAAEPEFRLKKKEVKKSFFEKKPQKKSVSPAPPKAAEKPAIPVKPAGWGAEEKPKRKPEPHKPQKEVPQDRKPLREKSPEPAFLREKNKKLSQIIKRPPKFIPKKDEEVLGDLKVKKLPAEKTRPFVKKQKIEKRPSFIKDTAPAKKAPQKISAKAPIPPADDWAKDLGLDLDVSIPTELEQAPALPGFLGGEKKQAAKTSATSPSRKSDPKKTKDDEKETERKSGVAPQPRAEKPAKPIIAREEALEFVSRQKKERRPAPKPVAPKTIPKKGPSFSRQSPFARLYSDPERMGEELPAPKKPETRKPKTVSASPKTATPVARPEPKLAAPPLKPEPRPVVPRSAPTSTAPRPEPLKAKKKGGGLFKKLFGKFSKKETAKQPELDLDISELATKLPQEKSVPTPKPKRKEVARKAPEISKKQTTPEEELLSHDPFARLYSQDSAKTPSPQPTQPAPQPEPKKDKPEKKVAPIEKPAPAPQSEPRPAVSSPKPKPQPAPPAPKLEPRPTAPAPAAPRPEPVEKKKVEVKPVAEKERERKPEIAMPEKTAEKSAIPVKPAGWGTEERKPKSLVKQKSVETKPVDVPSTEIPVKDKDTLEASEKDIEEITNKLKRLTEPEKPERSALFKKLLEKSTEKIKSVKPEKKSEPKISKAKKATIEPRPAVPSPKPKPQPAPPAPKPELRPTAPAPAQISLAPRPEPVEKKVEVKPTIEKKQEPVSPAPKQSAQERPSDDMQTTLQRMQELQKLVGRKGVEPSPGPVAPQPEPKKDKPEKKVAPIEKPAPAPQPGPRPAPKPKPQPAPPAPKPELRPTAPAPAQISLAPRPEPVEKKVEVKPTIEKKQEHTEKRSKLEIKKEALPKKEIVEAKHPTFKSISKPPEPEKKKKVTPVQEKQKPAHEAESLPKTKEIPEKKVEKTKTPEKFLKKLQEKEIDIEKELEKKKGVKSTLKKIKNLETKLLEKKQLAEEERKKEKEEKKTVDPKKATKKAPLAKKIERPSSERPQKKQKEKKMSGPFFEETKKRVLARPEEKIEPPSSLSTRLEKYRHTVGERNRIKKLREHAREEKIKGIVVEPERKINIPLLAIAVVVLLLTTGSGYYYYKQNIKNEPIEDLPFIPDITISNPLEDLVPKQQDQPTQPNTTLEEAETQQFDSKNIQESIKIYISEIKDNPRRAVELRNGFFVRPYDEDNVPMETAAALEALGINLEEASPLLEEEIYFFIIRNQKKVPADPIVVKLNLFIKVKDSLGENEVMEKIKSLESILPSELHALYIDEEKPPIPSVIEFKSLFTKSKVSSELRYFNYVPKDTTKAVEWGVVKVNDSKYLALSTSKRSTDVMILNFE